MASFVIEVQPDAEPISLAAMKNYLRVDFSDDDALIQGLITAARELVETFTARSIVNKTYRQGLDSFPYFTDTVMSQMAFPPSYYSLPRYSTTLWNYSQMIKLMRTPLINVLRIAYLKFADRQWHSLMPAPPLWYPGKAVIGPSGSPLVYQQVLDSNENLQNALNAGTMGDNPPIWAEKIGDVTLDNGISWQNAGPSVLDNVMPEQQQANTFYADFDAAPPRVFPGPAGSFWPSVLYVPGAVQIHFVAGYGEPDINGNMPAGTPSKLLTAMYQLVGGWYENREAISPLTMKEMPNHVKALLWSARVLDFQPTRG